MNTNDDTDSAAAFVGCLLMLVIGGLCAGCGIGGAVFLVTAAARLAARLF